MADRAAVQARVARERASHFASGISADAGAAEEEEEEEEEGCCACCAFCGCGSGAS
jgi:hypothetical protein